LSQLLDKGFSIVIPVKDEDRLILANLRSWYALGSDDLIICTDKPAPDAVSKAVKRVSEVCHATDLTRIVEVERNPEYRFHQAWVRRKGFLSAKHRRILTGDIDLRVHQSCLSAVALVGKDGVGLVSLSKRRCRRGFTGNLRNFMEKLARTYAKAIGLRKAGQAYFTGLYAIDREAWLDSEPLAGIKRLGDPKTAELRLDSWSGYAGEDTFLRDWMIKKHKVLYLPDIGADDERLGLEDSKFIQFKIGRKYAHDRKNLAWVLRHAMIHIRIHVIAGYMYERFGRH
jgi:hypothetical protein